MIGKAGLASGKASDHAVEWEEGHEGSCTDSWNRMPSEDRVLILR